MIPPLNHGIDVADAGGRISRNLHRWLRIIARAITSTYIADQAASENVVIDDGQFGFHVKRLILGENIRLTISGDGRLVIYG